MSGEAYTVVYVPCLAGRALDVLALDRDDGSLDRLQVVDLGGGGRPLASSPEGDRLFVSVSREHAGEEHPTIRSYAIDAGDGRVALLGEIDVAGRVAHLHADGSGNYLFAASFMGGFVSVYRLGSDGCPWTEPVCRVEVAGRPHQITTDDDNVGVLVPDMAADVVRRFRFDEPSGKLAADDPQSIEMPPGSGPRHLVRHPALPVLYVVGELDGSVSVCVRSADGRTCEIRQHASLLPSGFRGEPWAAEVRITPDGLRLFASERRSGTVSGFAVDPVTGLLTHRFTSHVDAVPRGFDIDPVGRWLVLAAKGADRIAVYEIDADFKGLTLRSSRPSSGEPNFLQLLTL